MRISKIRDLVLTAIIVIGLVIVISWFNQQNKEQKQGDIDRISGKAEIIDADSFFIGKNEIRLFGIDAPEGKQYCKNSQNRDYPCGRTSTKALKQYVKGQKITCNVETWDRYNRAVSICYLGKQEINDWIVRQGHALAYRKYTQDYVAAENEAQENSRGLWQGAFLEPWQWRQIHR